MDKNFAELLFRIFNDPRPALPPDAAYLFGQTSCNQESSFSAALGSPAKKILLLDTLPRSGYPGFLAWQKELIKSGIDPEHIQPVPMDDLHQLNSRTESQALIQHVVKQGFQTLEIIAPPFHQPRAFMTAVTIALEEEIEISMFNRPGTAMPWNETAVHSQGKLTASRSELIHTELARIETYQAKGDLASYEQVIDYLNSCNTK